MLSKFLIRSSSSLILPSLVSTPALLRFSTRSKWQPSRSASPLDPNSAGYAISSEFGLQKHIQKVYKTTGLSLAGIFGTSYLAISTNLAMTAPGFCLMGGGLGMLASVIAFGFTKCTPVMVRSPEGFEYLQGEDSSARKALYGGFIGCSGLSLAPLLAAYSAMNPFLIPTAFLTTTTICAGAATYAYYKPKGSLLKLGAPLMGGLLALIVLQLGSLGATWIYGPNMFSLMAHRADLYLGTGLFSVLVAYDTHVAISEYEAGNPDALGSAISMVLNFQNIFVRMLEILKNWE
jgi:FtsH-binding integral membrane protein